MISPHEWSQILVKNISYEETWKGIFCNLKEIAAETKNPMDLHKQTIVPDRLLSDGAWDIWQHYSSSACLTSRVLKEWWSSFSSTGKCILILDGLSLHHLSNLIHGADFNNIPIEIRITGSEVPSDTNAFARAIGLSSRSTLANNRAPSSFFLRTGNTHTDIIDIPFEDAAGIIPPQPNIFLWNTWPDKLNHLYSKHPDQVYQVTNKELESDAFWKFIQKLRQGRKVVITSDHGYAVSQLFSDEIKDPVMNELLSSKFGGSRFVKESEDISADFIPPCYLTLNGYHVVMGQRKWKVSGGFPYLCHGGMTLLEVAVPYIEIPPL